MIWITAGPVDLGFLPEIIRDDDPRPVKVQVEDRYGHGGGWRPMARVKLLPGMALVYPGDPPLQPIAWARVRDEMVMLYPHDWVVIQQPGGSFECSRMD